MRLRLCALVLFALGHILAAAQEQQSLPESQDLNSRQPRLVLSGDSVDLGVWHFSEKLEHVFILKNEGDAPLKLDVANKSCGCISCLLTGTTIAPGSSGQISVGYTPKNPPTRQGKRSFSVTLSTNDPLRKQVTLTVSARLVQPVYTDASAIDFGRIPRKAEKSQKLDIMVLRTQNPARVLSVKSSSPSLALRRLSQKETNKAIVTQYEVSLNAREAEEDFENTIVIETTSEWVPLLEIPVKASIPYPLTAKPPRVLFGIVEPHKAPEKAVELLKVDDSTIPARVACPDSRIQARLAHQEGDKSWRVIVSATPEESPQKIEKISTKVIVFGKRNEKLASVPVHALLRAPQKGRQ